MGSQLTIINTYTNGCLNIVTAMENKNFTLYNYILKK